MCRATGRVSSSYSHGPPLQPGPAIQLTSETNTQTTTNMGRHAVAHLHQPHACEYVRSNGHGPDTVRFPSAAPLGTSLSHAFASCQGPMQTSSSFNAMSIGSIVNRSESPQCHDPTSSSYRVRLAQGVDSCSTAPDAATFEARHKQSPARHVATSVVHYDSSRP